VACSSIRANKGCVIGFHPKKKISFRDICWFTVIRGLTFGADRYDCRFPLSICPYLLLFLPIFYFFNLTSHRMGKITQRHNAAHKVNGSPS
jgi:hypothetical protein